MGFQFPNQLLVNLKDGLLCFFISLQNQSSSNWTLEWRASILYGYLIELATTTFSILKINNSYSIVIIIILQAQ